MLQLNCFNFYLWILIECYLVMYFDSMCTFRDGDAFAIGAYCRGFSINLKIAVRIIVIGVARKCVLITPNFQHQLNTMQKFFGYQEMIQSECRERAMRMKPNSPSLTRYKNFRSPTDQHQCQQNDFQFFDFVSRFATIAFSLYRSLLTLCVI